MQDQATSVGIIACNLLHVWFPIWFGHACIFMLVSGSPTISGMVFLGYDNGFQPSLALFLDAMVCWDVCFGFLNLELPDGF